jgi:hypothetical protein
MSKIQKLKLKEKASTPEIEPEPVIRRTSMVYGSNSTVLVLPKKQIERIGITKHDFVRVSIFRGNSLLIEKVD